MFMKMTMAREARPKNGAREARLKDSLYLLPGYAEMSDYLKQSRFWALTSSNHGHSQVL